MWNRLRKKAGDLRRDIGALYLASRHPRVPWYARAVAALTLAYALSPIDLIPDFIPVLGYLDDAIIIPAGLALFLALIPSEVWAECRSSAQEIIDRPGPGSRAVAVAIVAFWIVLALWAVRSIYISVIK